jgi:sigma-B regulation protein RsbU (phosphoserine phosphatase)
LLQKRQNLTAWLSSTPTTKRQINLGPLAETAVQSHLVGLDKAIERAEKHTLGQCDICHEPVEADLLQMDYACCICLDHLSPEARRQLEYELELSTKVQQALLPQQAIDIPGMEVAAFSRPATMVGGDYFDFYQFQDGTYGLVIADVAGHGMSASLIMASLQASLRILVPESDSPTKAIERLNRLFYRNINMTNFVSLFLARFDPQTNQLVYCNAGHNPPLLYRAQPDRKASLTWLQPSGAAIGLVEEVEFGTAAVDLLPGDLLLLYTDGVTEATNPVQEEFGQERLADLVAEAPHLAVQDLVQRVRHGLLEFNQGQPLADDITVVACRIK